MAGELDTCCWSLASRGALWVSFVQSVHACTRSHQKSADAPRDRSRDRSAPLASVHSSCPHCVPPRARVPVAVTTGVPHPLPGVQAVRTSLRSTAVTWTGVRRDIRTQTGSVVRSVYIFSWRTSMCARLPCTLCRMYPTHSRNGAKGSVTITGVYGFNRRRV